MPLRGGSRAGSRRRGTSRTRRRQRPRPCSGGERAGSTAALAEAGDESARRQRKKDRRLHGCAFLPSSTNDLCTAVGSRKS
jgi:hypothetical protein